MFHVAICPLQSRGRSLFVKKRAKGGNTSRKNEGPLPSHYIEAPINYTDYPYELYATNRSHLYPAPAAGDGNSGVRPGGSGRGGRGALAGGGSACRRALVHGLVLGCIEANFCK